MLSESHPAAANTASAPRTARDRILDTAGRLFYREGYRAIGVDRVIAEADVAKATFYKHFPSKDALIVAWIEHAETQSAAHLTLQNSATPLTDYALAMIGVARNVWCMGCTYQGSAAEFADPAHPVHAAALGVKERVLEAMTGHAIAQGLPDPRHAAERVFLLLEGVWASVRMFGPKAPVDQAPDAVRRLIG